MTGAAWTANRYGSIRHALVPVIFFGYGLASAFLTDGNETAGVPVLYASATLWWISLGLRALDRRSGHTKATR